MSDSGSDVVAIGPSSGLQYVRIKPHMAEALEELELEAFPTAVPDDLYNAEDYTALALEFPEGSVIGFDDEDRSNPVAAGLGIRTTFDFDHPQHRVNDLIHDAPNDTGHDPNGDWYYGTDIVVRPTHRRRGIGRELYDMRKQICRELGLRGIVAGGVIPGFADHKHAMTADEYVAAVSRGELYDRTLTFQLENGFEAPCALAGYIRDPAVDDWAALIVWHNPDYAEAPVGEAIG